MPCCVYKQNGPRKKQTDNRWSFHKIHSVDFVVELNMVSITCQLSLFALIVLISSYSVVCVREPVRGTPIQCIGKLSQLWVHCSIYLSHFLCSKEFFVRSIWGKLFFYMKKSWPWKFFLFCEQTDFFHHKFNLVHHQSSQPSKYVIIKTVKILLVLVYLPHTSFHKCLVSNHHFIETISGYLSVTQSDTWI